MKSIEEKEVNNKHDKTFKIILENKEEAANFINNALNLSAYNEKIRPEELEKYNRNFITKNYIVQEADIIYKLKNRNIFLLIEHQTKVDYSMAYRILNYQIEIMRNNIEPKKVKNKSYEYALVISIVLYTGARKWTSKTHIRELQGKYSNAKNLIPILGNCTNLGNYQIVDINNYTKKELLESKSFLSKIMLLEKIKNSEELIENIEEISPKLRPEDRETLERILMYALKGYFNEEALEKIINNMKKGVDEELLAMMEMLKKEKQKIYREGKAKGVKELAKKMLKEKLDIGLIERITGLKRENSCKILKNT